MCREGLNEMVGTAGLHSALCSTEMSRTVLLAFPMSELLSAYLASDLCLFLKTIPGSQIFPA